MAKSKHACTIDASKRSSGSVTVTCVTEAAQKRVISKLWDLHRSLDIAVPKWFLDMEANEQSEQRAKRAARASRRLWENGPSEPLVDVPRPYKNSNIGFRLSGLKRRAHKRKR